MKFCADCGTMLTPTKEGKLCGKCQGDKRSSKSGETSRTDGGQKQTTELEALPTTESGNIKKKAAMEWLQNLDRPTTAELKGATIEKPNDFTGSTYPTDISTIRLTGDPAFIETIAGLFSWIVDMEDYSRRVEINLQRTEDRETGEQTDNYALYLSVAERGGK